jgi:serine protease
LRLITGLSTVAAIASVAIAWPSVVAQPKAVKMTAKRTALMGWPAPVKQAREPSVSRLIVKLRGTDMVQAMSAGSVQALAARAGAGMKVLRAMDNDAALVSLDTPVRLSEAKAIAARLAADPMVEYAEPDVLMKVQLTPTDADFQPRQWNLFPPTANYTGEIISTVVPPPMPKTAVAAGASNLPTAWDTTAGASSVVVAVIDTGIVNHPDLNGSALLPPNVAFNTYVAGGRFLPGYDFVSTNAGAPVLPAGFVENADGDPGRDDDPSDPGNLVTTNDKANFPDECDDGVAGNTNSNWHGSFTAGIIAATANNTLAATVGSVAGIGFGGVRILPVRALGKCGGALSDIVDAIKWSIGEPVTGVTPNPLANRPQVISLNFGGILGEACPAPLQAIINFAVANNVVFVAPTGNDAEFELRAPANCVGVIAVTAHTFNGENASYSNIGPAGAGAQPTISAPGGGEPASFGFTDPTNDPDWAGFYIWSTGVCGTTGPSTAGGCADGAQLGPAVVRRTGTSAAAAHVAGVAALVKSKAPGATALQVASAITTSARPFPDLSSCAPGRVWGAQPGVQPARCGIGMLDATRALQATGVPVVLTAPRAVTVAVGQAASFTVDAVGVVSYQWTRAGAAIADATSASYTTPALAATDNNVAYAVVMTNTFGATTSPPAVVTVSSGGSNSPSSGGGALPYWQLVLLSALLLAARVRIAYRKQ